MFGLSNHSPVSQVCLSIKSLNYYGYYITMHIGKWLQLEFWCQLPFKRLLIHCRYLYKARYINEGGVGELMAIQLTTESKKQLIAYFNYLKDYALAALKLNYVK